mgnify:CR=1 FL=1
MKQAVISLEGITKTYVNGKLVVPVLHGIDLNIYEASLPPSWVHPDRGNPRL